MPLPFGAINAAIVTGRAVVQAARLISRGFTRSGIGQWFRERYYGADKPSIDLAIDLGNAANKAAEATLSTAPPKTIDPVQIPLTPQAELRSGEPFRYKYDGLVSATPADGVEPVYRNFTLGTLKILTRDELLEELYEYKSQGNTPEVANIASIVKGLADVNLIAITKKY